MPFLEGGPMGQAGSGLPKAQLIVQPDKILQLKRRLEDRRDKILRFMKGEQHNLVTIPPPGADPCSYRATSALSRNGQQAMEATGGFVNELANVINALEESARRYGLVEEINTDKFLQAPE